MVRRCVCKERRTRDSFILDIHLGWWWLVMMPDGVNKLSSECWPWTYEYFWECTEISTLSHWVLLWNREEKGLNQGLRLWWTQWPKQSLMEHAGRQIATWATFTLQPNWLRDPPTAHELWIVQVELQMSLSLCGGGQVGKELCLSRLKLFHREATWPFQE